MYCILYPPSLIPVEQSIMRMMQERSGIDLHDLRNCSFAYGHCLWTFEKNDFSTIKPQLLLLPAVSSAVALTQTLLTVRFGGHVRGQKEIRAVGLHCNKPVLLTTFMIALLSASCDREVFLRWELGRSRHAASKLGHTGMPSNHVFPSLTMLGLPLQLKVPSCTGLGHMARRHNERETCCANCNSLAGTDVLYLMAHQAFESMSSYSRSFHHVPKAPAQLTSLLPFLSSSTRQNRRVPSYCSATSTNGTTNARLGDLSRLSPEAFLASRRESRATGTPFDARSLIALLVSVVFATKFMIAGEDVEKNMGVIQGQGLAACTWWAQVLAIHSC